MDIHSPGSTTLLTPKMGTTPPGEMEGALARLTSPTPARASRKVARAASCLASATLTAFRNGGSLELANCLENRTLAMCSGAGRTPLLMRDAEAPVAIARAEPLTAA